MFIRKPPYSTPMDMKSVEFVENQTLLQKTTADCIQTVIVNGLTIKPTSVNDIPALQTIFAYARKLMANTGNPNQWAENYPSEEVLQQDIACGSSYVCLNGEKIVATFVLKGGIDPTYNEIYGGKWMNDEPYATIHRIASNGTCKGVLHTAVQFALRTYDNIRIDTHEDNVVMQGAIRKEGFVYCGVIHCWSGAERLAFQYSKPK